MKSGTGEDPFADDPEPTDQAPADQEQQSTPDDATETEGSTPDTSADEPSVSDDSASAADTEGQLDQDDIPWVLRRSRVKDDRPEMVPVYVREETADAEPAFVRDVEEIVGRDVYKFDVREAALLVAMNHPEEVAEQLNSWGYEYLD